MMISREKCSPAYECPRIVYELGGRRILNISNLVIERESIHALVGPNGAGKTTLLKIIAGLLFSDRSEIVFHGTRCHGSKKEYEGLRKRTTLIMQEPFMFHTTVSKNVSYGMSGSRIPRKDLSERVSSALQRVGLSGFEGRSAVALSTGEKKRVALARGIILDRDVLLLDEPLAHVDKENIEIIKEIIRAIPQEGKTVVLSTHSPDQLEGLIGRTTYLFHGHLFPVPSEYVMIIDLVQKNGRLMAQLDGEDLLPMPQLSESGPGPAYLAIDPEKIEILHSGEPSPGENRLNGCLVAQKIEAERLIMEFQIRPNFRLRAYMTSGIDILPSLGTSYTIRIPEQAITCIRPDPSPV